MVLLFIDTLALGFLASGLTGLERAWKLRQSCPLLLRFYFCFRCIFPATISLYHVCAVPKEARRGCIRFPRGDKVPLGESGIGQYKKLIVRGWRDGFLVKGTFSSCRGPGFDALVPGDPFLTFLGTRNA